jgi:hypothetical protein
VRYTPSHATHHKSCKGKRATACCQFAASYSSLQGMRQSHSLAVQKQRLMVLPRSMPFVSPTTSIRSDLSISHQGCVRALARTFAGRAKFASLLCGEGKLELTESAREFQKVSAPQSGLARSGGEEAPGPVTPDLLFLRLQQLLPLLEHGEDRLRGTGVQAEAAAFQATGRVELVGRSREPSAGRADRNADGLMRAAVGMADEVIANDHHGLDSFKETLGKDLEHVSIRKAAHFHSFTSSFNRSFSSGCCSKLL